MREMITVIVPVYNEDENIRLLYEKVASIFSELPYDYELIYVNDGSRDSTFSAIEALCEIDTHVKSIHFSRNFGHQAALSAGYHHAKGDAAICMDGDLQHPPELIPTLIEKWKSGFEVVYTLRTETEGASLFKRISSKLFYKILRKLSKVDLQEGAADFRLVDRKVLNEFNRLTERDRFIRALIPWLGFKHTAVTFTAHKRLHGTSKYNFTKMFKFAIDGIISFSYIPLRLAIEAGVLLSVCSFIYLIYIVIMTLTFGKETSGWASLMSLMLFMFGVNLIAMGVLGEYIGRIYEESKNRPLYVISKASNL